jgi:hypothetical protein
MNFQKYLAAKIPVLKNISFSLFHSFCSLKEKKEENRRQKRKKILEKQADFRATG